MTSAPGPNANPADVFTRFWSEMFGKGSGAGMGAAFGQSREETNRQMQQAFFDAWARHCDEFMRSEAFLDIMKRSMDNAIAFRQQLNDLLDKTLEQSHIPTRGDTDSILLAVRRLEQRVLGRLDSLTQRVDELERRTGEPAKGAAGPSKPRAKGVPQ